MNVTLHFDFDFAVFWDGNVYSFFHDEDQNFARSNVNVFKRILDKFHPAISDEPSLQGDPA